MPIRVLHLQVGRAIMVTQLAPALILLRRGELGRLRRIRPVLEKQDLGYERDIVTATFLDDPLHLGGDGQPLRHIARMREKADLHLVHEVQAVTVQELHYHDRHHPQFMRAPLHTNRVSANKRKLQTANSSRRSRMRSGQDTQTQNDNHSWSVRAR